MSLSKLGVSVRMWSVVALGLAGRRVFGTPGLVAGGIRAWENSTPGFQGRLK